MPGRVTETVSKGLGSDSERSQRSSLSNRRTGSVTTPEVADLSFKAIGTSVNFQLLNAVPGG